ADMRPVDVVEEEYLWLARDAVRLRFRSDVPVGITLSGGVDSSALLGIVGQRAPAVDAFTFVTGDSEYDELPWARRMLASTNHRSVVCSIGADDVPDLAASVQASEDEPFGGVPTLAYARLFELAKARGTTVLLEGSGLDEQWAGCDYYLHAASERPQPVIQGSRDAALRPECLSPEFNAIADPFQAPRPFSDPVCNLQYRDVLWTKMPRGLRFNDRAS